jgi:hypothetical protein
MYRIRFQLLGFASFVTTFLLSLFTPGTWVNRSISVVMCGALGICSPGTVANILQGDRAVAADVPVLVGQRSNEFDNEPPTDLLAPGSARIRPDFDDNQDPELKSPLQSNLERKSNLPIRMNFSKDDSTYSAVISEHEGWNIIEILVKPNNSHTASRFSIKGDKLESKLIILSNGREIFNANKINESLWLFELVNLNGIKQSWNHQEGENIDFEEAYSKQKSISERKHRQ